MDRRRRLKLMRELGAHAGWRCHYCLVPLVEPGTEEEVCKIYFLPEGPNGELVKSYGEPEGFRWPQLDHKLPRALNGTDDLSNLVLCCLDCNSLKGKRYTYEDFYRKTAGFRGEE